MPTQGITYDRDKSINLPLVQRRMLSYGLQALAYLISVVKNPEACETNRTRAAGIVTNKCLPDLNLLTIDANTPAWVLDIIRLRAIPGGQARELPQQVIASEITTRGTPVAVGEGQSPESVAAQGIEG